MIPLSIDGRVVNGREGQTILSLAQEHQISIPTLCHDDRVAPQGACGLCVVEAEGAPRLLRACATVITKGMVIHTQTPRVRASRKAALELLLSAHTGDCRPPCMLACPAQTDCQGYIGLIANGQYEEAVKLMKDAHPLPASVGRICPHPCETACRRQLADEPVNIATLKYFAADKDLEYKPYLPETAPDTGKTVAIVGGGPAGLTAAYFIRRAGHRTVVYDAMPQMGGLLRYGIPAYRLPKDVLDAELAVLTRMGIVFNNLVSLGKDISLETLRAQYDTVVIATGAGRSKKLNCPGETLAGVRGGIDFLRDAALGKPMTLGKHVIIVGGSNTAMDAARTALRLGAEDVRVVYRRSREEMPAEPAEINEAEEEGVQFCFLRNPLDITGENGQVRRLRVQVMTLGEPDAGGRRSPIPVAGEEEWLEADTIIAAIGQDINLEGLAGLPVSRRGALTADPDTYATGMERVYAIGDVTGQSAYAIEAIGHARKAAAAICAGLAAGVTTTDESPLWQMLPDILVKDQKTQQDFVNEPKQPRENAAHTDIETAKHGFDAVYRGFTEEQARREAMRCLSCGCGDYFACKLLRYANEYKADPTLYIDGHEKPRRIPDAGNPYFDHEPDKCILCGLCVRVCDEVMGHTALGLSGRGFGTEVAPMPPASDCTNCGQCVALCPTGALQEKLPITKTIVVREETIDSVCAFCGVGCTHQLHKSGHLLLRSVPRAMSDDDLGLLCVKGRFGFHALNRMQQTGTRVTTPLSRVNGSWVQTTWHSASEMVRKKLDSLITRYGAESVGVAVADYYSLEDLYGIKTYATQFLGTPHVFSFNGVPSGLADVTGQDRSTIRWTELAEAEVILLAADDIMTTHTIAGLHIKKAVERGALLVTIAKHPTQADEWAHMTLLSDGSLSVLRQMTQVIMTQTAETQTDIAGYAALRAYLTQTEPSTEIRQAATMLTSAHKVVVVFDQKALTTSATHLLADMAAMIGLSGTVDVGMIQLKQNSNSQGVCALGIAHDAARYKAMLREKALKGLVIFGEDLSGDDIAALDALDFLAVCDLTLTETAAKADIILPAAAFTESGGHYTDTVGVTKYASCVSMPITGMTNRQVAALLSGGTLDFSDAEDIYQRICLAYPAISNDSPREGKPPWRADTLHLTVPTEDIMYHTPTNTHRLHKEVL